MSTTVYTVANERFFVGLLALVDSLRVNGYRGSIVVVDTGLLSAQRAALSDHVVFVAAPEGLPSHYMKVVGPLRHPDDVMVFIDADILCVRSLEEIIQRALDGAIVAFEDIGRVGYTDRLWGTWEELLSIGELEPATYVNSGFLAMSRDVGLRFFDGLRLALEKVDPMETYIHSPQGDVGRPFVFADQDVVNAILASAGFRDRREILPYAAAPHAPFAGVRVDGALGCVDEAGNRPYLLHHALQKPWLEALPSNPYTELLPRYLHHPDALAVDDRLLPPFLRASTVGDVTRTFRSVRGQVRVRVRGKLGLRPYLRRLVRRLRTRARRARG
jgi:hypothetical protein